MADVVVQKYAEHKPLYRQQQAFARVGIPLSRQTLCDWTGWCSDEVAPVVSAMADSSCGQPMVQSDETPVRMQLPDGQMQTADLGVRVALGGGGLRFSHRQIPNGPAEFLASARAKHLQPMAAVPTGRS